MKTYQYLLINLLLIVSWRAYAAYNYFINFQNLSNSIITASPVYHNCVYAFSNKDIIIPIGHTENIKIRANSSGSCAFEATEEEFIFSSGISPAGYIDFHMYGGANSPNIHSSGNIFDLGDYGQDFAHRWTFYSDANTTTTVTFW